MAKTWIHVYVDSYNVCVFRKKMLGEGKQKESRKKAKLRIQWKASHSQPYFGA